MCSMGLSPEGVPTFHAVHASTPGELQALLGCCVDEQGFNLHAEVWLGRHKRKKLESQGQGLALLGAPRTQHLCRP